MSERPTYPQELCVAHRVRALVKLDQVAGLLGEVENCLTFNIALTLKTWELPSQNIQYCLKEMLDIENRLASKTVPRNVKDFPTLWNKIMLMFVLATMIIGVVFTRAKQWSMILVIRTFAK